MGNRETAKKVAAESAVRELVLPRMKLGLGTGSTVLFAIKTMSVLFREGHLPGLLVVPTSFDTEILCQQEGLPVRTLNDAEIAGRLDLCLDGADEIDPCLDCIKGGGGSHLQEKIICSASDRFVLIVDQSKKVPHLGTTTPIPLEVHALARLTVMRAVKDLGAQATLRYGQGKQGPVITDNGHFLLDLVFKEPINSRIMETKLKSLVGVLEVGLFTRKVFCAYVGWENGQVEVLYSHQEKRRSSKN